MTTTTFNLQYPVVREGQNISVLTGRRAKVRDMQKFMRNIDVDPIQAMQQVLADLTDQPIHVIGDLDLADYAPMQKWFQDFLEPMKSASEA
jgi:hypothetical protein